MKLMKKTFIPVALLALGLWIGSVMSSNANSGLLSPNQPGSAEDPIVTKSYVDQRLAELGVTGSSTSLTVVEMRAGHSLIAFEGTEFIVRNGKTVAFSQTTDGIPDLTDGVDLIAGTEIPLNHLLLFPRSDGRGIRHADPNSTVIYVMVRGNFQHLDGSGTVLGERK